MNDHPHLTNGGAKSEKEFPDQPTLYRWEMRDFEQSEWDRMQKEWAEQASGHRNSEGAGFDKSSESGGDGHGGASSGKASKGAGATGGGAGGGFRWWWEGGSKHKWDDETWAKARAHVDEDLGGGGPWPR